MHAEARAEINGGGSTGSIWENGFDLGFAPRYGGIKAAGHPQVDRREVGLVVISDGGLECGGQASNVQVLARSTRSQ